eukprot:s403_g3.t1
MSEKNHVVEFIQDPVKCQMNFADRDEGVMPKVENRALKQLVLQLKGRLHTHKRLSPGGDDGDDDDNDGDDDRDDGSPNSSDYCEWNYIFITVEFPSPHFNIKSEVYFVHKHATVSDLKLKIFGHFELFRQQPSHFALFRGEVPLDDLEFAYLEMKDHDVLKFEMLTSEWHIPTNEAFITVCIKVFTNTEDDVPKEIRTNKFFTCRDFVYYVAGLFNLERFYHGDITLSCDAIAGGDDMMWHDHDILDVMDGGWKLQELGVKGGHTLNIKFGGRGGTVKRRVIAISERQAKEDDIPFKAIFSLDRFQGTAWMIPLPLDQLTSYSQYLDNRKTFPNQVNTTLQRINELVTLKAWERQSPATVVNHTHGRSLQHPGA